MSYILSFMHMFLSYLWFDTLAINAEYDIEMAFEEMLLYLEYITSGQSCNELCNWKWMCCFLFSGKHFVVCDDCELALLLLLLVFLLLSFMISLLFFWHLL